MKRKVYLLAAVTIGGIGWTGGIGAARGEPTRAPATSGAASVPAPSKPSADPSAEALLKEFDDLRPPVMDAARMRDAEYLKAHAAEQKQVARQRADLAERFYKRFPDHAKAGRLLSERWQFLAQSDPKAVMAEARAVADHKPELPARPDALLMVLSLNMMKLAGGDPATGKVLAVEFVDAYPKHPYAAMVLGQLAQTAKDPAERKALNDRLARDYPDSLGARIDKGQARRVAEVGKPFELSFTDAITGKPVSMADYKGKVVLIDFWATWCGPCVAQVPELKRLHAAYRDQGLAIVGVSLDRPEDEGGLRDLKAFVKKNEIPWPQYYQGKQWDGDFSSQWGVRSVPTLFLVDKNGNLVTTEAGHAPEAQIKQLLAAP